MSKNNDKAVFANQLRGLAVILVLIIHWAGIYWYARGTVADFIHAPMVEGPSSRLIDIISIPTVNYGALGVAIFFMISGFVIPFSLARASPIEFIVSRIFRIYPTYLVGSAFMVFCVWVSCLYWGAEFKFDSSWLISNLLLIHKDVLQPSMDLVNWTLAIEIKFYLIAALMYRFIRSGDLRPFVLFSVAVLGVTTWRSPEYSVLDVGLFKISLDSIMTDLMFVCYMFIGVGFYNMYIGRMRWREMACYSASILLVFMLCWSGGSVSDQFPGITINYIYGLGVFTVCYAMRSRFKPLFCLDFMAKISYPLYMVHAVPGYAMFRILMDVGVPYRYCLPIVFVFMVAVAYVIHLTVEVHTAHAGKKIFRFLHRRSNERNEAAGAAG
ncbi:acyltransferase family protein [Pseudomonas faucium]|uniref:acyltransferase family protein n=1 Tax=Pseudomonas faucium TaxID=2740518 RepID=UPI0039C126BB